MVLPQPSKLKSWVRFPSAAHFKFMRKYIILIFVLLSFISCTKTEERNKQDKIKAEKLILKAIKHYNEAEYNDALKIYLKIEKLDNSDPLLYFKIGFCYDKGPVDYKNAKKYYLKSPEVLDENKHLSDLAASYFHLGVLAFKNNNKGDKFEYFNQALELFDKMLEKGNLRGVDYFRIGYYYYDREDFKTARKYFQKALKSFQKEKSKHIYYAAAYYNIGVTYWKEEDVYTSLYYWKIALTLEPDNEIYQSGYNKALERKNFTRF